MMVCICSLMRTIMSINRHRQDEPFGYTRSVWLLIYRRCGGRKRDATLLRPLLISHQQPWPQFPHSSVEWLPKDTSLASFGALMHLRHCRSVNYRISTLFQVRRSVSKWDLPYQSGCVYAYIYTLVFSLDACSKPCSAQSPLLDSFPTMALQSRCIYPRTHPCSRGSQCIDVPPVLFWLRGPLDVDCDKNNSS